MTRFSLNIPKKAREALERSSRKPRYTTECLKYVVAVEAAQSPDLSPCQQLLLRTKLEAKEANRQQLKGNFTVPIRFKNCRCVVVNGGVRLKTGPDGPLPALYFSRHHFGSICAPRATVLGPLTRGVSP